MDTVTGYDPTGELMAPSGERLQNSLPPRRSMGQHVQKYGASFLGGGQIILLLSRADSSTVICFGDIRLVFPILIFFWGGE